MASEAKVNRVWVQVLGLCESAQLTVEWLTDKVPDDNNPVWEAGVKALEALDELEAEIRRAGGISDDDDEEIFEGIIEAAVSG